MIARRLFRRNFIYCLFFITITFSQILSNNADAYSYNDAVKGKISEDKIYDVKNSIEWKRKQAKKKIKQLEYKEKKEINKLYRSQNNLEQTKKDLVKSKKYLHTTKSQLSNLHVNLNRATEKFNRSESHVSRRIKEIYKGEKIGIVHLLLAADDINSLLDTLYYQKIIAEKDSKVMSELRNRAEKLASYTQQVENQKNNILLTIGRINQKKKRIAKDIYTSQYLINKLRTDKETYTQAEKELAKQSAKLASMLKNGITGSDKFETITTFIKPVSGRISSPFGWRKHPIFGSRSFHSGIDIAGVNQSPIKASNSGKVVYSGWYGGYGKVVIVSHGKYQGKPTSTLYAHLARTAVNKGANVAKGQIVGYEGTTGYSTGPHLHFEVRLDGKPSNPMTFIK